MTYQEGINLKGLVGVLVCLAIFAYVIILGADLLFGGSFLSPVAIVPAGTVAVMDTFGSVLDVPLSSGLHFKLPWANAVVMSVRIQSIHMLPTGGVSKDDVVTLTSEQLKVDTDMTVLYHIESGKAPEIYKRLGTDYQEGIVIPEIRSVTRETVARHTFAELSSGERASICEEMKTGLNAKLNQYGITVDDVALRNVDPPAVVTDAVEKKIAMETSIKEKEFEVLREKAEADRKRAEAEGIADANRIISTSLTENYLNWYWIEEVAGKNNTVYVPSDGGYPVLTRGA